MDMNCKYALTNNPAKVIEIRPKTIPNYKNQRRKWTKYPHLQKPNARIIHELNFWYI